MITCTELKIYTDNKLWEMAGKKYMLSCNLLYTSVFEALMFSDECHYLSYSFSIFLISSFTTYSFNFLFHHCKKKILAAWNQFCAVIDLLQWLACTSQYVPRHIHFHQHLSTSFSPRPRFHLSSPSMACCTGQCAAQTKKHWTSYNYSVALTSLLILTATHCSIQTSYMASVAKPRTGVTANNLSSFRLCIILWQSLVL